MSKHEQIFFKFNTTSPGTALLNFNLMHFRYTRKHRAKDTNLNRDGLHCLYGCALGLVPFSILCILCKMEHFLPPNLRISIFPRLVGKWNGNIIPTLLCVYSDRTIRKNNCWLLGKK